MSQQRTLTLVAITAALAVLAGCTSSDPEPTATSTIPAATATSAPPSPSPTPTIDPAVQQAETEILEAYRGFWDATVVTFGDPSKDQDPNLQRFSDDTALTDTQSTLLELRRSGIAMQGQPELTPVVSDIILEGAASATITDCVDSTNWQPVFVATGESAAAPDQPARLVTVSTAFKPEDRWLIRTSVIQRDQPC
ncbi:hypothetical protein [Cellulomonas endophytica]|uniref:hypothetical protein n=1 Tax=Cellulomonas endophytica TaxID=2494735 RepID=UPI001010FD79|nr:hypothetical protein [Cellulomonas endophytica]